MTNITNKYKDRTPKETIKIVQDFFNSLNLKIEEDIILQSECETWSCRIYLYANEELILASNGKGMNKEFALASGYAELFERFCNKNRLFMHPIALSFFIQLNKNKKGYFLHPQEKQLTFEDFKTNSPNLYNLYLKFMGNDENIKLFFSLYIQDNIVGVPMKNCFNDSIIYEDIRLWQKMFGSSALSAGNTLEEALIQGISELFEHYAYEQFFINPNLEYCEIDLKCLNSANDTFKKIRCLPKYKTIRLFDLSYNFKVPVCLGIIIDNKNLNISFDFGSAPTFEIAAERVITELYQLHNKNESYKLNLRSMQYDAHWSIYVRESLGFPPAADTWPLWFMLKSRKVDKYNTQYFMQNDDFSNKDFLDFYKKLVDELGFDLYYYNSSPIPDLFAIQIISHNKPYMTFRSELIESQKLTIPQRHFLLTEKLKYMNNFLGVIHSDENIYTKTAKIREHLLKKINYSYAEAFFLEYLEGSNWHQPLLENSPTPFYFAAANNLLDINQLYDCANDYYRDNNKKYIMLYDFKSKGILNDEEIQKLFINFGIAITKQELDNITDSSFFFYVTIIQTLRELYSLPEFDQMIEAYHKIC